MSRKRDIIEIYNKYNMDIEYYKSPEKENDGLTPEQRELADYFLPQFKENVIPEEERRDCNQEAIELQNMFIAFKDKHQVAELYSIIDLTVEDAPNHPTREPAKRDLAPILAKLNILKKETNITTEKYDELQDQYRYLSRAVGMISGDKVRH